MSKGQKQGIFALIAILSGIFGMASSQEREISYIIMGVALLLLCLFSIYMIFAAKDKIQNTNK
jgi:uncharacterized membrane protein YuzA (DUF378 family)